MHLLEYPLQNLPVLPKIVRDYLSGKLENINLYTALPDVDALLRQANNRSFSSAQREVLVDTLNRQYGDSPHSNAEKLHIESLLNPNTFTVTTGHQICLLTGPLYFIYKIASIVQLCRTLNDRAPDKNFVPLFWMATEDHDFEEINHVFQKGEKIVWDSHQAGAVGRMNTHGLSSFLEKFEEGLDQHVKDSPLWEEVKTAYREKNLADATWALVRAFFSDEGVVVLDADDPDLKRGFLPQMERELFEDAVHNELAETADILLEKGYKTQVNPREINLFYLADQSRDRLVKVAGGFETVGAAHRWNEEEMRDELERFPDRFSPNVVLRPLYQEYVLPNIAYIGGPGEISYWLQLKKMFDARSVEFPILVLRTMGMVFPRAVQKKCDKLGLAPEDVFKSYDALVAQCLQGNMPDFEIHRKEFDRQFDSLEEKLRDVDPSLLGTVAAEKQKLAKSLDKLESKALKSLKRKDEDSTKRIASVKDALFPHGAPQERTVNIFEVMGYGGLRFLTSLMEHCNPLDLHYRFFMVDTTEMRPLESMNEGG